MHQKTIFLSLPEYTLAQQPDYEVIGAKIDHVLEENFLGLKVAIRAISLADHPQMTREELTRIVLDTGTDKYDPNRKGVDHEEFAPYQADLQAGVCTIGVDHFGEGADFVKKFYENVLLDRGYRLRIDLFLIYDYSQLIRAEKMDAAAPGVHPRLEEYLFRFKDQKNRAKALLGIIEVM